MSAMACDCGAPLRCRGYVGRRSIALCANSACGEITLGNGLLPQNGLREALLAVVPVRRYQPPWLRFFHKTTNLWGCRWFADHRSCPACGGEITMRTGL